MSPREALAAAASADGSSPSTGATAPSPGSPNGPIVAGGEPIAAAVFNPAPAGSADLYKTIDLTTLRREEGRQIADRRFKAGVERERSFVGPPTREEPPPKDLVGVALSGGGVRSSMFNTGVLQGLDNLGLLKRVDYLATVSGGGFIGGFFTSQFNKRGKSPLKEDEDGQNASVNQLTRNGGYLNGPVELGLRVAAGVTLHLLIIATLLMLSCALLSWLWRLPDMTFLQRLFGWAATRLDQAPPGPQALVIVAAVTLPYLVYYSPHLPRAGSLLRPSKAEDKCDREARLRRLWRELGAWLVLVVATAAFVAHEGGFFAVHRDWFAMSDLVRALIPFGVAAYLWGILEQSHKAALRAGEDARGRPYDPRLSLRARVLRFKNLGLVVALLLSILTLLANGDTDLGPRIGDALQRLLPSLGRETASSQVSLQVRNSESVRQWLTTITQYLLFIQLFSGIIPVLLPRQFASSGGVGAGGFSRGVYRSIIFLLFISLPLVVCFLLLHENVSGAVQVPSPIQRLAVSRDPTTGAYGYLIDHDQWTRFRWFLAGLLGFVALNHWVDLNRTSLHQYYRRRLKDAYFDAFPDAGSDALESDGQPETRLHDIDVGKTGAPYPLLMATLNEIRPGSTSLDSGCAFIFAPRWCGWSRNQPIGAPGPRVDARDPTKTDPPEHRSCFIDTRAYGQRDPKRADPREHPGLRLVDAMAISGAAITPSNSHSVLDTILLLVANARLGQWLINPEVGTQNPDAPNDVEGLSRRRSVFERLLARQKRGRGIPRISAAAIMRSVLRLPGGGREFCFLSDGAHYDNLGLETLFERRCRLIIASDASYDPRYEFGDLSKALRRLRTFWGVEFFLDRAAAEKRDPKASRLIPWDLLGPRDFAIEGGDASKKADIDIPLCRSRHLVLPFRYPDVSVRDDDQRWGLLVVLKPALRGREDRESAGLFSHARLKKTFPMDDDMHQFFDENQCEYYRELGRLVASSILDAPTPSWSRGGVPTLDEIMDDVCKPRTVDAPPAPDQRVGSTRSGMLVKETADGVS